MYTAGKEISLAEVAQGMTTCQGRVAVVFDSAGTLLRTYRVARDVISGQLMPGVETVMLTFSDPSRVLLVLHLHSQAVMEEDPETLLSLYLTREQAGFGVSCTRSVMTTEEIANVLYRDTNAHLRDLQECIRNVWLTCRDEEIVTMNSGVIVNLDRRGIEFTVTTGGSPFPGAKEVITTLHRMGVPTFIASGDRATKLERMADFLGIPRDRVYGVATPGMKAEIVRELKQDFQKVVMVGDGINDLNALREADVAVLSEEQGTEKPSELYAVADHVIGSVRDVTQIVTYLCSS